MSHQHQRSQDWAAALQHAVDSVLPDPVSPDRSRPQARIIAVSPTGTSFEIELSFRAGRRYCCAEPGCFLSTYSRDWWARFRAALREVSDRDPPPLSITIQGVVEPGAILEAPTGSVDQPTPDAGCYRCGPDRELDAR